MKQSVKKFLLLMAATVSLLLQIPSVQAQEIDARLRDDMQAKHYEPGGKYHLFGNARGSVKKRGYAVNTFSDAAVTPILPISHERSGFTGVISYETHFSGHGHEVHGPFDHRASRSQSDFRGGVDGGFTVYTLSRTGSEVHPADGYDGPQGGGFPAPKGARDIYSYHVTGTATKTKINTVPQAPFFERWKQENGNALPEVFRRTEEASKLIWESKPNQNWWGNSMDTVRGLLQGAINPFLMGFEGVGLGTAFESVTEPAAESLARGAMKGIHGLNAVDAGMQHEAAATMQNSTFAVRDGINNVSRWAAEHPNSAATVKTAGTVVGLAGVARAGKTDLTKWLGDNPKHILGKDWRGPGPRQMSPVDGEMAGGSKSLLPVTSAGKADVATQMKGKDWRGSSPRQMSPVDGEMAGGNKPPLPVTSAGKADVATQLKLQAQLIGQEISGGHAFNKHVVIQQEFTHLGITTRNEFAKHIENIVANPSDFKQLSNGRSAYWDDKTGTVVIRNPKTNDGGTAFIPKKGKDYFKTIK